VIKPLSVLLFITGIALSSPAQYWQQQVNYIIDVSLNDKEHTLDGFEKLEYLNNSPDTLSFIWFHLWPNAYKNDKTAFSEQLLINNRTDFYFSRPEQRGYINRLDFKVNGTTAQTEDHPQYIDIIKLLLPYPLPPGNHITITTPFHIQIPENFSRSGHKGQSYQVTQWYPKPAVYDAKGWHPIPYLDQGEFYSEFGNYDVRITLPGNYAVAATGTLQNTSEREWLKKRSAFNWEPVTEKVETKGHKGKYAKKIIQEFPPSSAIFKTLQYKQDSIHDFAWFADKRYTVNSDTLQLPSGKIIDVYSYYLPAEKQSWENSTRYIKNAVLFRSAVIGEYPYPVVSAVDAQMGFSGGMEYPTITSISPYGSAAELEATIEHEVGHNWLYGILATNERVYPWMDEGMNTYYDNRYKEWKQSTGIQNGSNPLKPKKSFIQNRVPDNIEDVLLSSVIAQKKDQPINTPSEKFTETNYGLIAYTKTGDWMKQLEIFLGRPVFDSCMREYYRRWQFRHPCPEDFKAVVETVSTKNADTIFSLLNQAGPLQPHIKKQIRPVAFFSLNNTDKYNYINFLPATGYNLYDGFMIGLLIHNYSLPFSRFRFLLAPLYAAGSRQLNYLARASYTWFPSGSLYKTEAGISASRFSDDAYQPDGGSKIILRFRKYAPFLRLTFRNSDALSKTERYIQLKTFFFSEDGLDFKTTINGTDTLNTINRITTHRYLNQLKFAISNPRILYPYDASVQVEQARDFTRAAFTGNYYFNYAGREGGLKMRFFAGKFFYNGARTFAKQFATDRYQLNLTGANGYEDYTYSDYFIGRNKFEGMASQQVMMRDGFFKVRTDLLSSKTGKTDNWLSSVNLTSDIPKKLNPLNVLPVKIPIKLFADIGTYAEAWQKDAATSKFLYDAGIQVALLKETVNIYFPILYSKTYRDYFNSTLGPNHFWKTVSFSIDISNFSLKKINRGLDL
jgi:hypothetical protein